jgi:hypothetical protein
MPVLLLDVVPHNFYGGSCPSDEKARYWDHAPATNKRLYFQMLKLLESVLEKTLIIHHSVPSLHRGCIDIQNLQRISPLRMDLLAKNRRSRCL